MNIINKQLQKIQSERRLGLMTHAVVGYPSVCKSVQIVKIMAELGVDFIELQIPFAGAHFEGPTLMHANKKSFENHMTSQQAMHIMYYLSRAVQAPLLFMTYFKVIH